MNIIPFDHSGKPERSRPAWFQDAVVAVVAEGES